jgi:hypothetical protein
MKHAHAGRPQTSNRGKPVKLRRRALNLIKKTQEKDIPVRRKRRFGPTLAAEHLADEDGIVVDPETLPAGGWRSTSGGGGTGKKHCQTKGAQGALWRADAAGWAEVEMKLNDALPGIGHVHILWA